MGALMQGPAVLPGREENCAVTIYEVNENRHTVEIVRTWSCSENPLADWAASKPTKDHPKDFRYRMGDFHKLTHDVVLIGAWVVETAGSGNYTLGYKDYRVSVYHDPLDDE